MRRSSGRHGGPPSGAPAPPPRPAPHGGLLAVPAAPPGTADFSSSVSPAGAPPAVARYLRRAAGAAAAYPDPLARRMRAALAAHAGVPAPCVVAGNGATGVLYELCRALLRPGSRALVPAPAFSEYEAAARMRGCRVSRLEAASMAADIDRFVARIPERGCAFLCSPSNPAGEQLRRRDVVAAADEAAARSSYLIVDECFIELSRRPAESVSRLAPRRPLLFVLRSLTKSFALAGLRAGYGIAARGAAAAVAAATPPWSVSTLAQGAAEAAVGDARYLPRARRMVAEGAAFLREALGAAPGLECLPTDANFMLVRTRLPSRTVRARLLSRGLLVRDCSSFAGLRGGHIRVAVRPMAENRRLAREARRL